MLELKGHRWGVIGTGATGLSAARYLLDRGAAVLAVDDDDAKLSAAGQELGGQIEFRPAASVLATDVRGWIVSPGVPPSHDLVRAALDQGRVYSDLDLWQHGRRCLTVAVTGTNGKSTVTRLLRDIFAVAGQATVAGGNLGPPVCDLIGEPAQRAVLEVSSFQLCYAQTFKPELAVLTNLAPDHLDWHPDRDHYYGCKFKLFAGLDPEGLAVIPHALRETVPVAERAMVVTFGSDLGADVRIGDEVIDMRWSRHTGRVDIPDAMQVEHLKANLAAAAAAAFTTGIGGDAIGAAAAAYAPLDHRFELVADHQGIRYIDDSKATNLHAMAAAVRSAGAGVHLLVGGKDKGLDWAAALPEMGDGPVHAYAFGESGPAVAAAWEGRVPVSVHETLGAAAKAAHVAAVAEQTVLLSPGSSSFDQFASYAERGEHFAVLIRALIRGEGMQ